MNKKETNPYIEAIKFAASCLQYKNISIQQTFCDAVSQLYWYYINLNDKSYLEIAILHIQAYLEMGFSYEDNKDTFNKIFQSLGTTKEMIFPQKFYASKKIRLNKSQVRSMIKRWPASPHQTMKINDVVNDIIDKIRKRENGVFYYKCAVTDDLYELVISKEIFFYDVARGTFYTFKD